MLFYICISSLPVPFSEILQHSLCHLAPDGCSHPQPVWQPGVSMHFKGKKSRQAENSFYPPTLWQLRVSVTQKGDDGAFSDSYSGQGPSSTLWKQAGPSLCLSGTQSCLVNNWGYCWNMATCSKWSEFSIHCEHLFFGVIQGKDQISIQIIEVNKKKTKQTPQNNWLKD